MRYNTTSIFNIYIIYIFVYYLFNIFILILTRNYINKNIFILLYFCILQLGSFFEMFLNTGKCINIEKTPKKSIAKNIKMLYKNEK